MYHTYYMTCSDTVMSNLVWSFKSFNKISTHPGQIASIWCTGRWDCWLGSRPQMWKSCHICGSFSYHRNSRFCLLLSHHGYTNDLQIMVQFVVYRHVWKKKVLSPWHQRYKSPGGETLKCDKENLKKQPPIVSHIFSVWSSKSLRWIRL